ncbi:ABC transporter substrate-binding protein [Paenibacillus pasadenensis]|uniref:ABC transporter substrate-binding protein n=1 Tax=Paenibacillus pasadenensis TaxID=217090 RepID=UPI00203D13A7|nr:ABC transporter substrate-binding protein [Paenibacillus pasadenensis]MCM3746646.1 ABC transporter substrate-binding protein [Paenibacillus pasadenensis]
MKRLKVWTAMTGMAALLSILGACGNAADNKQAESSPQPTQTAAPSEQADALKTYTDYIGHKVEYPANPQKVVFAGETTGDLLELDLPVIGIFGDDLEGRIYQKEAEKLVNIGFPINLEKITELEPDLIIIADTDDKVYQGLSKIAPVIVFDTFASLHDRMNELGKIFGKEKEAAAWLETYDAKEAEMWKGLYDKGVIAKGETASVLTYYPGDRLFIMARAGLPQLLYGKDGFAPLQPVKDILAAGEGFREISLESIHDFAADRIFILDPVAEEAKRSTEELLGNPVFKHIPAVQKGHVYRVYIQSADSDAASRLNMIEELPRMLEAKQ